VLIVADDLGYGELGCYGQRIIETPRLDQLAQEGMRFTQFYSGGPVCAPARCVLLTGKHAGHAAIRNNRQPTGNRFQELREKYGWESPGQQPLPDYEVTIAELLKSRGYTTAGVGKWGLGHIGTSGEPNQQGFDYFYGFLCQAHAHNHFPRFLWRNRRKEWLPGNDGKSLAGETYAHVRFVEEALQFIRAHRDEPFFLFLPFTIPHLAIQVPPSSLTKYQDKFPETPYDHESNYVRHPTPRAGYAAMVSHMDHSIGKIVDLIDELGLGPNTLIMFTSDNGPTFRRIGGADSDFFQSAGPLRGRKGSLYEGGIRVPLIARWLGHILPGQVSDHIAAFCDMLPTLCEMSSTELPDNIDGISFKATLLGCSEQRKHDYLYWEFPAYGFQQAVRCGDWKVVRHNVDRHQSRFELYNLKTDLAEAHDLASKHPEIVQQLAAIAASAHSPSRLFPLLPDEFFRMEKRKNINGSK
jgi:arylsulfatase